MDACQKHPAGIRMNMILPKVAIPTHYGSVAGSIEDGMRFAELVDPKVEVRVMM